MPTKTKKKSAKKATPGTKGKAKMGRPPKFGKNLVRQELRLRKETKDGIKKLAAAKSKKTGKKVSVAEYMDEVLHTHVVKTAAGSKASKK